MNNTRDIDFDEGREGHRLFAEVLEISRLDPHPMLRGMRYNHGY